MPVDVADVRRAFRRLAIGVSILTTLDGDTPHGATGMAWAEHGDPPLLLTTLRSPGRTYELIEAGNGFGVSVLAAHQSEVAWRFAARSPDPAQRFAGVATRRGTELGVPLVEDCVATFECALEATHPFGAYRIVIGRVLAFAEHPERQPLVHFAGDLWAVTPASTEL